MKLITTEKPSVAKEFAEALGAAPQEEAGARYFMNDEYVIISCFGHMLRQKNPDEYSEEWKTWEPVLRVPESWEKVIADGKVQQTKQIIKFIKDPGIEEIINAGDAGREGEGIQREIYDLAFEALGRTKPIKRFWTSNVLSKKEILHQLENLKDGSEFDDLYEACLAREQADWIVGLNATRAFTSIFGGNGNVLSIGRVQTPVLALIAKREREIADFREKEYYNVLAGSEAVTAKCVAQKEADEEGNKFAFWDKAKAQEVIDACSGKPYNVVKIESKEAIENPPKLFSMPTLQQHCNKVFGWSPDKTLDIAQKLYEKRFQTYPRTDSEYMGTPQQTDEFIQGIVTGIDRALESGFDAPVFAPIVTRMQTPAEVGKRVFNDAKLTDHHAIIPSDMSDTKGRFEDLEEDEKQMLLLVASRFLLAFNPPAVALKSTAELENSGYTFEASAKSYKSLGWMDALETAKHQKIKIPEGSELNLTEGSSLELTEELKSLKTTPPKPFTEGEVIAAMTNAHRYADPQTPKDILDALKNAKGIGTGATRDQFVPTLEKRGYLTIEKSVIKTTQKGRDLVAILDGQEITDFAFTALIEDELARIESGEASRESFLREQTDYTSRLIEYAKSQGDRTVAGGKEIIPCQCGGSVKDSLKAWECEACGTLIWKETAGKTLSHAQAKRLFAGDRFEIDGFKKSEGAGTFKAPVMVKDGKLVFDFEKMKEPEATDMTCQCGGIVNDKGKLWECPKCESTVWKTTLGKQITKKEAHKLFEGIPVYSENWYSETKRKKYPASVKLVDGKAKPVSFGKQKKGLQIHYIPPKKGNQSSIVDDIS